MFYATNDADGSRISRNAHISAFETKEEARAYLLRGYDAVDWKLDTAIIGHGSYGDCWIKVHSAPRDYEHYFRPFRRDQLIIELPGQHPGGQAWWLTPREPILVIEKIDEVRS